MNQFRIILRMRVDGQVQVTGIRIPTEIYREDPFIKDKVKNRMEKMLKNNNIMVLEDVGVVQYD